MLTLQQCCNNYTFFIFMSCKTCHSTATRLIPRTKCNLWNIWRHLLGLLFSPWVTRTVVSATIWSLVVSHVRLYSFGLLRCFFPFFLFMCNWRDLTLCGCFRYFQLTKEMVMEKPSAQLVGREFVRQYYTLLNQAPDYLHRCKQQYYTVILSIVLSTNN